MNRADHRSLRHNSLSFLEGVAQTIGGMAPSGGLAVVIPLIFAKAGNMSAWMFVPMMVGYLLLAAVFQLFAVRTASAGGLGSYGELAFGRFGGLVVSWTYLVALIASVANGAAIVVYYAIALVYSSAAAPSRWTIMLLVLVTGIVTLIVAYRGIKFSTDLMLVIEGVSLGAMVVLVGWALMHEARLFDPAQLRLAPMRGENFHLAFILAFSSLSGFETVTALGEESKNATRSIPRAIVCCIAPIGLLYVLMAYVMVLLFHHSPIALDQTETPFEVLAASLRLPLLGKCVSAGVILSFFAMALGCLNAGARILYDLAKKGEFWSWSARVHPVFASPVSAVLVLTIISLAAPLAFLARGVSLSDTVGYIIQFTSYAFIGSYLLITVAAPVYLYRCRQLTGLNLAVCAASFAILGVVASLNLYPVPSWPWNIIPYVFVATVAAGVATSVIFRASRFHRINPREGMAASATSFIGHRSQASAKTDG